MTACSPFDWTGLGHLIMSIGLALSYVGIKRHIKNGNGA